MLSLFLWQLTIIGVSTRNDSPIVIERPLNRVEFDDLLMEYNHDQGPAPNVTVHVNLVVNSARLSNDILRASVTLDQTWNDVRLSFKGVSEVPLPNNVHPWQPDTLIINALHSETRITSSSLNYDGTIRKRQLLFVEVPCDDSSNYKQDQSVVECPMEITSFANRGVDQITYKIEHIDTDRRARFSHNIVIYDSLLDHYNRTSHMATVLFYLKKPQNLRVDLVDKMTTVTHSPGHH